MRNYVGKTESIDDSDNMSNSNEVEDLTQSSHQAVDKAVASLTSALLNGIGFTLSEVLDKVNKIMHSNQITTW